MSVLAIDFHLLHHRELDFKVLLYELVDLSWRTTFLSEELIARERQNLESGLSPPSMSFDHLSVIIRGESSLASDIGDHDKFSIPKVLEVKLIAPDVSDLKVEESLD